MIVGRLEGSESALKPRSRSPSSFPGEGSPDGHCEAGNKGRCLPVTCVVGFVPVIYGTRGGEGLKGFVIVIWNIFLKKQTNKQTRPDTTGFECRKRKPRR